jgi:hypothetical protein
MRSRLQRIALVETPTSAPKYELRVRSQGPGRSALPSLSGPRVDRPRALPGQVERPVSLGSAAHHRAHLRHLDRDLRPACGGSAGLVALQPCALRRSHVRGCPRAVQRAGAPRRPSSRGSATRCRHVGGAATTHHGGGVSTSRVSGQTSPTSSVWRTLIQLSDPTERHHMASTWAERPTRPCRLTDVTVKLTMPTSLPRRAEAVQRVRFS